MLRSLLKEEKESGMHHLQTQQQAEIEFQRDGLYKYETQTQGNDWAQRDKNERPSSNDFITMNGVKTRSSNTDIRNKSRSIVIKTDASTKNVVQNVINDNESGCFITSQDVLLSGEILQSANNLSQGPPNLTMVACNEEIESPSDIPWEERDHSPASDLLTTVSSKQISLSPGVLTMSEKELNRRRQMRDLKQKQRENKAYRENERQQAKERMQTLRKDPVYRYHERQRDRERRKNARLSDQLQRIREREKDRAHKSYKRSLEAGSSASASSTCPEGTHPLINSLDDSVSSSCQEKVKEALRQHHREIKQEDINLDIFHPS